MRRPLLLAGAALAALFALACSDSADEPLTAEQAAAIVEAGLLTEEDLPSSTWTVTDGAADDDTEGDTADSAPDADDMFGDTAACQDLETAIEDLVGDENAADTHALAEGERTFEAGGGDSLVVRSVQSSVSVPADSADVEAGFEALRKVFNAETLRPCFEEGFMASFTEGSEGAEGITVTELEVTEPATIARDGVGVALDFTAIAFIIPIELHLEMHFWPQGDAVGSLMIMEMNSELLRDGAADLLTAAEARLADAVEANR